MRLLDVRPALPEAVGSVKLTDDEQRRRYETRAGWCDGIPEGHFAILDPHDPATVTSWRVKAGRLTPWPKEARNGPQLRAWRHEIPRDRVERAAFWETKRLARRGYLEQVHAILRRAPEEAAARYAATTFRCAVCNRQLKVPESNAYGVGPECRSWMPSELLTAYAENVAHVRAVLAAEEAQA